MSEGSPLNPLTELRSSPLVQSAVIAFRERFENEPQFIASAPGRVNLIGEHTDYNQGFVLPIAIDRHTVIAAAPSHQSTCTIVASDLGTEWSVDLEAPLESGSDRRLDYLLGVAHQFHTRAIAVRNINALVQSTVPMGAGLGSSAALEVAFATLLLAFAKRAMGPLEVAQMCRQAEHEFPGVPCGIMDMYVAAGARGDLAMLIDCRNNHVTHVPCDLRFDDCRLLVIDTGVHHTLANGEYRKRRQTCEEAARFLGVRSLRDATIDALTVHGLSEVQRRRTLHVIAENTRTILAAEAIALKRWEESGELMFASHDSLRDLFEVSCDELDCVIDTAKHLRSRGSGVFGARMTGGGFGGCAIVLASSDALPSIRDALEHEFVKRFGRPPADAFITAAGDGAKCVAAASMETSD